MCEKTRVFCYFVCMSGHTGVRISVMGDSRDTLQESLASP